MNKFRALVTGGANGLGKALCDQLASDGWLVLSVDQKHPTKAKRGTDQIEHLTCDLSDRQAVNALPDRLKAYAPFDLVILNAAASATGKFEEMPYKSYEKLMRLNAETPLVLASQLAGRGLISKDGRLVFVASLACYTGYPGAAVYAASKNAIACYAKSIARPFAKLGIKVLTVFPGPLRTEHANRHSPNEVSDQKRITPVEAAPLIIKDILLGKKRIYLDAGDKIIAATGWLAPSIVTFAMRKIIYEKLDKNVY